MMSTLMRIIIIKMVKAVKTSERLYNINAQISLKCVAMRMALSMDELKLILKELLIINEEVVIMETLDNVYSNRLKLVIESLEYHINNNLIMPLDKLKMINKRFSISIRDIRELEDDL